MCMCACVFVCLNTTIDFLHRIFACVSESTVLRKSSVDVSQEQQIFLHTHSKIVTNATLSPPQTLHWALRQYSKMILFTLTNGFFIALWQL